MKRRYYSLIFLLLLGIVIYAFFNQTVRTRQSLLPGIEPFAHLEPLDPERLEGNLFVALVGFAYPGEDYLSVAQSVVNHNHQYLIAQHEENRPVDFDQLDRVNRHIPEGMVPLTVIEDLGDGYATIAELLPLSQGKCLDQRCLEEILEKEEAINRRIEANSVLFKRYDEIYATHDHYATLFYPYGEYNQLLDNNGYLIAEIQKLSNLRLAEAIIKIAHGNLSEGIAILSQMQENSRRLFAEPPNQPSLLLMMVAQNRMDYFNQILNRLLDSPYITTREQLALLEPLFKPLTSIEKEAVKRAIHNEITQLVMPSLYPYLLSTFDDWEEARSPNEIQLSYAEREIAFDWIERRLGRDILGLSYGGKRATNHFKLRTKGEEQKLERLRSQLWAEHYLDQPERYFSDKGITFIDLIHFFDIEISPLHINEHYQYLVDYVDQLTHNPYGRERILIEQRGREMGDLYDYSRYYTNILSMDEAINRDQLLILKYRLLKEWHKNGEMSADAINQWLSTEGDLAINRITGEPFQWDHDNLTLRSVGQSIKESSPQSDATIETITLQLE